MGSHRCHISQLFSLPSSLTHLTSHTSSVLHSSTFYSLLLFPSFPFTQPIPSLLHWHSPGPDPGNHRGHIWLPSSISHHCHSSEMGGRIHHAHSRNQPVGNGPST